MVLFNKEKTKDKKVQQSTNAWPLNGDVYFWVRSDIGAICQSEWADDVAHHHFRKDTGNCFRTRADARKAIEDVETFVRCRKERYA